MKDGKYFNIAEEPRAFIWTPLSQDYSSSGILLVRTKGNPESLFAPVRGQVQSLDPNLPLFDVNTLNVHMRLALFPAKVAATVLGVFGLVALMLAAIGVYGITSYAVAQRTHEIGIRLALGAQLGDVLRLVLSQGLKLTIIGAAIGLFGAYLATRAITSVLYGVSATDPLTFVFVSVLLIGGGTDRELRAGAPRDEGGAADCINSRMSNHGGSLHGSRNKRWNVGTDSERTRWKRYLKISLRYESFLKRPGFLVIAVSTLALGIGATTAMFTVVNSVLLRPLQFPEPERIVLFEGVKPRQGIMQANMSCQTLLTGNSKANRLNRSQGLFRAVYFWALAMKLSVCAATQVEEFFPLFRTNPIAGRTFQAAKCKPA